MTTRSATPWLRTGNAVMFAGDSITDCGRRLTDQPLGYGYPLRIAGEWGLQNPSDDVVWKNSGVAGDKVSDLESRWEDDVIRAAPDLVSLLVGANDVTWHTFDPEGRVIPAEEFEAGYERLLAPLRARGVALVLIEPFLVPLTEQQRALRGDLAEKIDIVRRLGGRHGARLLTADGMFARLAAASTPEHWVYDGVHPTAAGHAAIAAEWIRLVG